ncbi:MAG: hypothetical protein U9R07_15145 [Pseudomonadota bacterium]|nr:hypothetical protein [Pseudomonadota bacterium]
MTKFARLLSCLAALCTACGQPSVSPAKHVGSDPIDYDASIHLDAESLAEMGMKDAYEELQRQSGDIGVEWAPMREKWDGQNAGYDGGPNYRVEVNGKVYPVFGSPPAKDAWAGAAATFFQVVNSQLSGRNFKFYAINSGNDLLAVRLTNEEFQRAQIFHKGSPYAPYLPNYDAPNYGLPQ